MNRKNSKALFQGPGFHFFELKTMISRTNLFRFKILEGQSPPPVIAELRPLPVSVYNSTIYASIQKHKVFKIFLSKLNSCAIFGFKSNYRFSIQDGLVVPLGH